MCSGDCSGECTLLDKLNSATERLSEAIYNASNVPDETKSQCRSMIGIATKHVDKLPKGKQEAMMHSVYTNLMNITSQYEIEVDLCCEIGEFVDPELGDLQTAEENEAFKKAQYDLCEEAQNIFIGFMKNGIPADSVERVGCAAVLMTMLGMGLEPREGASFFTHVKTILTADDWKSDEVAANLLAQIDNA